MTRFWPLLLVGALVLLPGVRGDPAISSPGPGQGVATWTFSNAANYTVVNATIGTSGASLAWTSSAATDTSEDDFAAAVARSNVNLTASPGDVRIDNTSIPGPAVNVTWQPDPSNLSDNDLNNGNGGKVNYGTSPELVVGNWGGGAWWRAILQFPRLPIPANATLVGAKLQLYFYDPIVSTLMYFSVHGVTDNWSEDESTWNARNTTLLWTTPGGDFDPTALDTSAGVGTTPGWFTWNITSLAAGWWTRTVANDGLLIRQAGDTTTALGNKGFYSADATNASLRPRLLLSYTTPGSRARLESRLIDAGGTATWNHLWWNATLPPGTSVRVTTRSGNTASVDASWSPWSLPAAPGGPIASPPARYLQYALDLSTWSTSSPAVHDVSAGMGRYAAAARIDTQDFAPAGLQTWGIVSLDTSLPIGTFASLAYSQDNGTSWIPVPSGTNLSSALVRPIRLRIGLSSTNTTATPLVHDVTLTYATTSTPVGPPGGGPASPGVGPWFPWIVGLVVLGIVAASIAALILRARAFHPTELFLVHADGRLIARVGAEQMQDEIAATAVFTLVLQFVRDSFRSPEGTGGVLRSLEVDEQDVSIARGRFLYLALVSEGPRPAPLSARMYGFLAEIEAKYGDRLERWDGLRAGNESLEADLMRFLHQGYRSGRPGRTPNYLS